MHEHHLSEPNFHLITHDYPPRHGGVARYNAAVVEALRERCSVTVLSPARLWMRDLRVFRRSTHTLVSEVLPLGTAAWIAMRRWGIPYSVFCHGLDLRYAMRVPRKRWIAARVLRGASIIIANSAYTARLVRMIAGSASDVSVVHPPVGCFPTPRGTLAQATLSHRKKHPLVLSVGRLIERKGFSTLIDAMAIVQQKIGHSELVIIGSGSIRRQLEREAVFRGVPTTFVSDASDDILAEYFASCDVFALLPRGLTDGDVEGFGIVYLEAGAFGKPVIGTKTGGVPEAIVDGTTGILIPPDDAHGAAAAIIRLLEDPEYARQLGSQARRRVAAEFSADHFVAKLRTTLVQQTSPKAIL